jgi:hypothetical protein
MIRDCADLSSPSAKSCPWNASSRTLMGASMSHLPGKQWMTTTIACPSTGVPLTLAWAAAASIHLTFAPWADLQCVLLNLLASAFRRRSIGSLDLNFFLSLSVAPSFLRGRNPPCISM